MPYTQQWLPFSRMGTSHEAALSVAPSAATLRGAILARIKDTGGMTCDEVEVDLAMRHQTASARIRELTLGNLIREGGERLTRSGRKAIVWKAA